MYLVDDKVSQHVVTKVSQSPACCRRTVSNSKVFGRAQTSRDTSPTSSVIHLLRSIDPIGFCHPYKPQSLDTSLEVYRSYWILSSAQTTIVTEQPSTDSTDWQTELNSQLNSSKTRWARQSPTWGRPSPQFRVQNQFKLSKFLSWQWQ